MGTLKQYSATIHVYDAPYRPIEGASKVGTFSEGDTSVSRYMVSGNSEFGFVCHRYAFALRTYTTKHMSKANPRVGRLMLHRLIEVLPTC